MSTVSIFQTTETKVGDDGATALTRARYQRISRFYDRMERMMERRSRAWRKKQWELVRGPRVLEAGVGTGKNIEFWPAGIKITAVDLTPDIST